MARYENFAILKKMLMSFVPLCGLLTMSCQARTPLGNVCGVIAAEELAGVTPPPKMAAFNERSVRWSGETSGNVLLAKRYDDLLASIPKSPGGKPLKIELADSSSDNVDRQALAHEEGYVLKIGNTGIELIARRSAGVARGLVELSALAATHGGVFPEGKLTDWPLLPIRALHFVARGDISFNDLCRMADFATMAKFNRLIVLVTPTVGLSSFGVAAKGAPISDQQFAAFVAHAESVGLGVIPELKLLTHQEKLLGKSRPDLMYDDFTYDPRKEETYKIIFPIIDQVLRATHSKVLLIGHDEVSGWNPKRPVLKQVLAGRPMIPVDLFLQDTIKVNDYLRSKGNNAWMWGDMLLSPAKSPGANRNFLHGRTDGYGEGLLNSLPKNIVICDWQYAGNLDNFRTMKLIGDTGFKVIGATWFDSGAIKNFSNYAVSQGALGMIATTWFFLQRKQWDRIARLVTESGLAYWGVATKGATP